MDGSPPTSSAVDSEKTGLTHEDKLGAWIALIPHSESRRILRLTTPPVMHPRRADVGVPQPFLDFGNVRVVLQHTGRGCRPQGMRSHVLPSGSQLLHVGGSSENGK